jgi:hypothetical protein
MASQAISSGQLAIRPPPTPTPGFDPDSERMTADLVLMTPVYRKHCTVVSVGVPVVDFQDTWVQFIDWTHIFWLVCLPIQKDCM